MNSEGLSSPGLLSQPGAAYELKYHVPAALADSLEVWVRARMRPDPHGEAGRYRTTSVYCDTANYDVYRRAAGFRRSKYRLRRYGESPTIYLERKTRQGDRVWKQRDSVAHEELVFLNGVEPREDWKGVWFRQRLHRKQFLPKCRISYVRTAFLGGTPESPLRLTLDREVIGMPTTQWEVIPVTQGKELVTAGAILEMKFRDSLPGLFRELLALLPTDLGRVSKYRLCIDAWGLVPKEV